MIFYRRAPWLLILGVIQALFAGLLTRLAFPDPGWWPLAIVGPALWWGSLRGRGRRTSCLLSLGYGYGFFIPLLAWSGVYVGIFPWLALATLEALYMGLLGVVLPWVIARPLWQFRRALLATAVTAALFTGQEALRSRTPFGGFPWGRLAFSQADSPLGHLAAWGGAPLVTFATAWIGALVAWGVVASYHRYRCASSTESSRRPALLVRARSAARPVMISCVLGVAVLMVGWMVPLPVAGKMIKVAAVQGNVPRVGLDFNAQRRAVLDNHAQGTVELANRISEGRSVRPDIVLWPENSSDLDPYRQVDARNVIDQAVNAVNVPTLVGAVLQPATGKLTNTAIVWQPDQGPGDSYSKRHPVPFAEYVPYRSFFRKFSTKVDLVRNDFGPGSHPGILALGPATVGVSICFEVAYDAIVRDTVTGGADLLIIQTNNATFGATDESVQQLAISRLRAIEHGRAVAHISTVGVSALILPNGQEVARTDHLVPALLENSLPLRTEPTLADRLGGLPEAAIVLLGLWGCVLALRQRGVQRRNVDSRIPRCAANIFRSSPSEVPGEVTDDLMEDTIAP